MSNFSFKGLSFSFFLRAEGENGCCLVRLRFVCYVELSRASQGRQEYLHRSLQDLWRESSCSKSYECLRHAVASNLITVPRPGSISGRGCCYHNGGRWTLLFIPWATGSFLHPSRRNLFGSVLRERERERRYCISRALLSLLPGPRPPLSTRILGCELNGNGGKGNVPWLRASSRGPPP